MSDTSPGVSGIDPRLPADLAAAYYAARELSSEASELVTCGRLGADKTPGFDERLFARVCARLTTNKPDRRVAISVVAAELVPVADRAALFGASCAHRAAVEWYEKVFVALSVHGHNFGQWCAVCAAGLNDGPNLKALWVACEREVYAAFQNRALNERPEGESRVEDALAVKLGAVPEPLTPDATTSATPADARRVALDCIRDHIANNRLSVKRPDLMSALKAVGAGDQLAAVVLQLEGEGALIPGDNQPPEQILTNRHGRATGTIWMSAGGPTWWRIGPNALAIEPGKEPPQTAARGRGADLRRDAEQLESESSEGETWPPQKVTRAEAEQRVRAWLLEHAKDDPFGVTRDAVAKETGVSAGMVSNTNAWKAFQQQRKARTKPGERAIPLSDQMKARIPADCATPDELAELIEEQEREQAEEERRHKRRHKPS